MDRSLSTNINNLSSTSTISKNNKAIKRVWSIGPNNIFLVSLDKEIVDKLGINETDTFLEQELIKDEIVMRVKRFNLSA